MALRYAKQSSSYMIGSSDTAATLTAAYTGNQVSFPAPAYDYAILYVEYTPAASSRNAFVQVEGGPTSADFFPKTAGVDDINGNTTLLDHIGKIEGTTGGTTYKKRWEVPINDRFLRVSVKEDGVATFGTVKVQILLRHYA